MGLNRIGGGVLLSFIALTCGGCNVIGMGAQFMTQPGDVKAAYNGLAGQTVGVMVWVDRGPALDFPQLQADIAKGLTKQLSDLSTPKKEKDKDKEKVPEELKGIRFLNPLSVMRFQQEHPELAGLPAEDVATRLGVARVIYIEVYSFQTRSNLSVDLFRGTAQANVQALEVSRAPDGVKTAKAVYTDPDMRVNFPAKEVEAAQVSNLTEQQVYQATVNQFITEVGEKFYRHPGT